MHTQERIICLNGQVDETVSANIVAQLLFLEADNPEKPISLYINSPGGSVTAGTSRLFLFHINRHFSHPYLEHEQHLHAFTKLTAFFSSHRPRNLRHNDLHRLSRYHHLCRSSRLHGLPPPLWRRTKPALLPPTQQHHGASTLRRLFWASL